MSLGMLWRLTWGWTGAWILAGYILTVVDGLHAYGRDVWIQNVHMYRNTCCLFRVSGPETDASSIYPAVGWKQ